jgi:hypothetical protein
MSKATRRHRRNVDCSDDSGVAPCRPPGSNAMSRLNPNAATKFEAFARRTGGRASSARELPGARQRGGGAKVPDRGRGRLPSSAADDPFAQS